MEGDDGPITAEAIADWDEEQVAHMMSGLGLPSASVALFKQEAIE